MISLEKSLDIGNQNLDDSEIYFGGGVFNLKEQKKNNFFSLQFFLKHFTSFRFTWSLFGMGLSLGTFSLVLSDKFSQYDPVLIFIGVAITILFFAVMIDILGLRQGVNESESLSNPISVKIMKDVEEIKERLNKLQK